LRPRPSFRTVLLGHRYFQSFPVLASRIGLQSPS
jgi:hypothetical protein